MGECMKTFIALSQPALARVKMKLAPYALALGIIIAILILRAPPTFAQTPQQGGGYIFGWVYGFNMWDELVPLEWVPVTATSVNYQFAVSTGANGTFEMFVPAGTYNLTVNAPGYKPHSLTVAVSEGSPSMASFYLEQSGVPIPEFPAQALSMIIAIALAVTLLSRKSTKRKPSSLSSA
jgi:hypothetical protein